MSTEERREVRCSCPGCSEPIARIVGGRLVIVSRHHGDRHVNALNADDVIRLLRESEAVPAA